MRAAAAIVAMALVFGCGGRAGHADVAVSIFPLYDVTRRIAGDRLAVALVLPPGRSEHAFEPAPRDLARLADVKVGLVVGLDLDRWAENVMRTAGGARIVLVHGCRQVSELAYGEQLVKRLRDDEVLAELLSEKLIYYPTVTREPFQNRGRVTDLIESGKMFDDIGLPRLDLETDRVMLCGNPSMLEDLRRLFAERGFEEGNHSEPGHFVIEKAFVER